MPSVLLANGCHAISISVVKEGVIGLAGLDSQESSEAVLAERQDHVSILEIPC